MRILLLLALFGLAFSTSAQQADRETDKLSKPEDPALALPALLERLRAQNPQVIAARWSALAAQSAVSPAAAPDNPQFSLQQGPITGNPLAIGNSQGLSWSLSQNLPWPGKRRLAGQVAQAQADQAQALGDALQNQLLGQLRTTYFQWALLRRQIVVTRDTIVRLGQVKSIAQVRYSQNAAAFIDFVNAQVAESSARNDLLAFEQQALVALAQMNVLAARPAQAPVAVPDDPPAVGVVAVEPLADLRAASLRDNPQVRAEEQALVASQRNVALQRLGSRPDFSVSMGVNSATPPWGVQNVQSYVLQVGVTFPLWYGRKERHLLEQAQRQAAAEEQTVEAVRQQTLLAVETAYRQRVQAAGQVELLRSRVVEQARVAYRLALGSYGTGQGPFIDVSNALVALRNAELSLAGALAQQAQARVALDVAVGRAIE